MTAAWLALLLAAAPGAPAAAAERPQLADLAYALGEVHALRQACKGSADGLWRDRMAAVLKQEQVERERRLQLTARFNAGFAAARTAHPECDAGALSDALARAAPLARALARPD